MKTKKPQKCCKCDKRRILHQGYCKPCWRVWQAKNEKIGRS